ncbi:MAG: hypothetical protein ACE14V_05585 [bacterium]
MRYVSILVVGIFSLFFLAIDCVYGEYQCTSAFCFFTMSTDTHTTALDTAALALLDNYAKNQDTLASYIVNYEEDIEIERFGTAGPNKGFHDKQARHEKSECRYDGKRYCIRQLQWGSLINVPKEQPMYYSILYDGKLYVQSNSAIVKGVKKQPSCINPHPNQALQQMVQFLNTGLLMGYMEGDSDQRIDTILRQAKSLKLRQKQELINGSPCYVIEGITRKGKYTIWFDPEHGYNLARVVIERREGDFYLPDRPSLEKGDRLDFILQDIRFERIANRWVPMEVTAKQHWESLIGKSNKTYHHKRTQINLNPDFTNAFIPNDIPDGNTIWVVNSTAHVPAGSNYTWKNGKPCDKQGTPLDFSE